jgi:Xaa-Pro aminopeptidase
MSSYFSKEFFINNRANLRRAVGDDEVIVVGANGLLQRGGDGAYPFAQDANFWYLTGLDQSDLVLVMDGFDEYLIVPDLSSYQSIFDGSMTAEEFTSRSGIADIRTKKDGWKELRSRLIGAKSVATLQASPAYLRVYGMYSNPARRALISRLKSVNRALMVTDISPSLARLRAIKQAPELQAMRRAINLTNEALDIVASQLGRYKYEYEIESTVSSHVRTHGAIDAWKPVVGAGRNSCILHSSDNDAPVKNGDVIVVDVGAQVEHYCADITRTFPARNSFSERQQAVYDAVAEVQAYGIGLQKVGSLVRENEAKVEAIMGEQLIKLGLITKPERAAIRRYFPHATSHFLGINPHDAGDYQQPLQAGMVVTVEPGIYIAEENIGVRIEDDILITEDGCEVLSRLS